MVEHLIPNKVDAGSSPAMGFIILILENFIMSLLQSGNLLKYNSRKMKLNLNITSDMHGNPYGIALDGSSGFKLKKTINSTIGFKIGNPHFESYNKLEFQFKFNKTSNTLYPQIIGEVGSYWKQPNIWITNDSNLNVGIPSGADRWDNTFTYTGISNNTWYTIWFEVDNVTRICKFKLYDSQDAILDSKEYTFTNIEYRSVDYIGFLFGFDSNHNFIGELDLEKCYIKCDGNLIWGIS